MSRAVQPGGVHLRTNWRFLVDRMAALGVSNIERGHAGAEGRITAALSELAELGRRTVVALCLLTGCQTSPTCADIMSEPPSGPVAPAWAKRGLSLAPDAVPCAGDGRRLHAIEATTTEPHVRAIALREELIRQGWAPNGREGYEREGDYVVNLRRGKEILMFNVHRAEKLSSVLPDTPSLAIHAAVGTPP